MRLLRNVLGMPGDLHGREVNVHRIGNVPRITARHHDCDRQTSRAAEIQDHMIARAILPSPARAGRADPRDEGSAPARFTPIPSSSAARGRQRPLAANNRRHGPAGFPYRSLHAARTALRLRITPPASHAGAEVSTSASGTGSQTVASGRNGRCRRLSLGP